MRKGGRMAINTAISFAALLTSLCSLLTSLYFWKRSARPLVSIAVKTHEAGSHLIAYDLVVLNSGSFPARNIRIVAKDGDLTAAFGRDATVANKERWLSAFRTEIALLQNNDRVSCSFGTTEKDDAGFWKAGATIPVTIHYEGWHGSSYCNKQSIRIIDSESFTGYAWENPKRNSP